MPQVDDDDTDSLAGTQHVVLCVLMRHDVGATVLGIVVFLRLVWQLVATLDEWRLVAALDVFLEEWCDGGLVEGTFE